MKSAVSLRILVVLVLVLSIITCGINPIDPAIDPGNADVELFIDKGSSLVIAQGDICRIGLAMSFTHHFDRITVASTCGVLDTTIIPDTGKQHDTIYFVPRFTDPGKCIVTVTGVYKNSTLKDKQSATEFYVEQGAPGVLFVSIPTSFATHTGKVDTLFLTSKTIGSAIGQEYAISSLPQLDQTQLSILSSTSKDTVRILFNPAVADTYTVFVTATAQVPGAASVKATVQVGIRVYTVPSVVVNVTPENNAADVSIEPTFTWTGGDDADGDSVFYKVLHGTSADNMTMYSDEMKGKSYALSITNRLTATTKYFWQVIAYTKTPYADTVKSQLFSFTTADAAPAIITQPAASVAVVEGQTLTLSVAATGIPAPTYQWYKDNVLLSGKTGAEFSKAQVTAADAGSYHVAVANGNGTDVVSNESVVTIRGIAKITEDPQSMDVNEGGSVTFTVKAEGEMPLVYQWLKDGAEISGATTASYKLSAIIAADDNESFRCVVSNSFSNDTSVAAVVSITTAPVYKVAFSLDGGTPATPEQQVKQGGKAIKPAGNPTKAGYEFSGWYTSETFSTEFNFTVQTITDATIIYAKWVPVYTVTYVKNGGNGSVPVDCRNYRSGELVTVIDKSDGLARKGYAFTGWNTNAAGTGASKVAGDVITIGSASVVLYAMWKAVCTITFDGLGATTAPNPTEKIIDLASAIGMLPSDPKKTSYVFDGWYTGSNGTGNRISASTTISENFIAYAKWVIKDVDGNEYTEVKIGNQVWMVENLTTTKFSDGTIIPLIADSAAWANCASPAVCWYDNDLNNKQTYGALYNWYAVDTKKLAPDGWHVPSDVEWDTLLHYLIANGYNYDGTTTGNKIAKAMAAKSNWSVSTITGVPGNDLSTNNKSGFTALPGGCRGGIGNVLITGGIVCSWWSSIELNTTEAYMHSLSNFYYGFLPDGEGGVSNKHDGLSVRCLRDN